MDPTMEAARAHPSKISLPKYALLSSNLRSKTAFENSDIESAYPGTPLLVTNSTTNIERELHNKALKIYERLFPGIFYDNEQEFNKRPIRELLRQKTYDLLRRFAFGLRRFTCKSNLVNAMLDFSHITDD
jgi:hypothetical protein